MTSDGDQAEPDEIERGRSSPRDWLIEGYAEGEAEYLADARPDEEREVRTAIVYDDREEVVLEADVDEDERRYVPREGTEREVGPAEGLGEVLEEFGERLHWDSLSEFAREELEGDEGEDGALEPETVTFSRSNVLPDADHDVEFTGAYTYRVAGQVFDVERTFEVEFDDPDDPDGATAAVTERGLRAAAPDEGRRAGDAELLSERETAFEIDLDEVAGTRQAEGVVEERCLEWHEESEPGLPV